MTTDWAKALSKWSKASEKRKKAERAVVAARFEEERAQEEYEELIQGILSWFSHYL